MLPTNRPLTPDEIAQVARDFKRWLSETRRSMGAVSKTLGEGFSPSVLSQFGSAVYKGDCEKIARAVNEYMERHAVAAEASLPEDFVETDIARRILTVCRTTITSAMSGVGSIGLVTGPAGYGKTKTAEAATRLWHGAIYIRVNSTSRRAPGLINTLCGRLGAPQRNSADRKQQMLVEHLKGSSRPLFVDEAHRLAEGGLEAVRDLVDEAAIPCVLLGTVDLNKHVNDTEMFYGQFNSRVVARCDITEKMLRPKNPRPLTTVEEIIEMFGRGRLRLTNDGARFLCALANLPGIGGFRVCAQLCRVASGLREFRGKPVDEKTLRAILREFHGVAYSTLIRARTEPRRAEPAAAVA